MTDDRYPEQFDAPAVLLLFKAFIEISGELLQVFDLDGLSFFIVSQVIDLTSFRSGFCFQFLAASTDADNLDLKFTVGFVQVLTDGIFFQYDFHLFGVDLFGIDISAIQDFTDEIAVEVGFLPDVVQDFRDRSGRIPYRTKFSIIVRFHLIAFGNVCKQFLQCDILCGIGHCFSFQVIHFVLAPDRHWNTPADQRYISFKFRVQVGIISEFNLHLIPGRQQFLQVFSGKVFDTPGKDYFCRVCQHLP